MIKNYFNPATPFKTSCSLVKVPVLSKQQISTFPANGILNGSVQKIAILILLIYLFQKKKKRLERQKLSNQF